MEHSLISNVSQRGHEPVMGHNFSDTPPTYPSASLLKPLYAWVAGPHCQDLAEAAIRNSSNTATDLIVEKIEREEPLTDALQKATQTQLPAGRTWGSIPITSLQVIGMYRHLLDAALTNDEWARQILSYMGRVSPEQRFQLDFTVRKETGTNVALKAGWDLKEDNRLYTHAVCLSHDTIGVVLTSIPVPNDTVKAWDALLLNGGPASVIPMHETLAGTRLRETMRINFTSDTGIREET